MAKLRRTACIPVREATEKVLAECYEDSKNYATMASNFKTIDEYFGDRKVAKITSKDVYTFQQSLQDTGLSDATINRKVSALSVVLKKALIWGELPTMPTVEYRKERNGRIRWLTDEEEVRVLEHLQGSVMESLVIFLLDTGCRLSEALNVTKEDVQDSLGLPSILIWEGKTGHRSIPLTTRVLGIAGHLPFTISARQAKYQWSKCRKTLGLDDVNLHTLRHTFASRLVQRGVDLYRVKALLGHSTISTTERYAHLAPNNLQDAISVLNIPAEVSEEVTEV